jgi:hypothetical protein
LILYVDVLPLFDFGISDGWVTGHCPWLSGIGMNQEENVMAAQHFAPHGVMRNDSAVLAVPASAAVLQADLDSVLSDLAREGISASTGSASVSQKPTLNSNYAG